jgi:predicted DNA-binding transcriptional regulator AlpA
VAGVTRSLLRVDQLATYIGQSTAWCRTALADGTIPGGRKIRGRWMVAQADVDVWVDAGRPERDAGDVVAYAPPPRILSRTV